MARVARAKKPQPEPEPPQLAEGGIWAIVELMGHVRMAGYLIEEEKFGAKMGRIEIPRADAPGFTTQWFGGGSVYRITPTTEEVARAVAKRSQPTPVSTWELNPQRTIGGRTVNDDDLD